MPVVTGEFALSQSTQMLEEVLSIQKGPVVTSQKEESKQEHGRTIPVTLRQARIDWPP